MSKGIVTLLGPDGCGKSTIARGLMTTLQARGATVWHQHWRPHILPSPRVFIGQTPSCNQSSPHAKNSHPLFISVLLSIYYWLDFWLGYFVQIVPFERKAKGGVIITERYIYDILFDPLRHRLQIPEKWAAAICRRGPRSNLLVVLTGDPQKLYERKREIPATEILRQQDKIMIYLRDYPKAVFISTMETSVEETVEKIIDSMKVFKIYE